MATQAPVFAGTQNQIFFAPPNTYTDWQKALHSGPADAVVAMKNTIAALANNMAGSGIDMFVQSATSTVSPESPQTVYRPTHSQLTQFVAQDLGLAIYLIPIFANYIGQYLIPRAYTTSTQFTLRQMYFGPELMTPVPDEGFVHETGAMTTTQTVPLSRKGKGFSFNTDTAGTPEGMQILSGYLREMLQSRDDELEMAILQAIGDGADRGEMALNTRPTMAHQKVSQFIEESIAMFDVLHRSSRAIYVISTNLKSRIGAANGEKPDRLLLHPHCVQLITQFTDRQNSNIGTPTEVAQLAVGPSSFTVVQDMMVLWPSVQNPAIRDLETLFMNTVQVGQFWMFPRRIRQLSSDQKISIFDMSVQNHVDVSLVKAIHHVPLWDDDGSIMSLNDSRFSDAELTALTEDDIKRNPFYFDLNRDAHREIHDPHDHHSGGGDDEGDDEGDDGHRGKGKGKRTRGGHSHPPAKRHLQGVRARLKNTRFIGQMGKENLTDEILNDMVVSVLATMDEKTRTEVASAFSTLRHYADKCTNQEFNEATFREFHARIVGGDNMLVPLPESRMLFSNKVYGHPIHNVPVINGTAVQKANLSRIMPYPLGYGTKKGFTWLSNQSMNDFPGWTTMISQIREALNKYELFDEKFAGIFQECMFNHKSAALRSLVNPTAADARWENIMNQHVGSFFIATEDTEDEITDLGRIAEALDMTVDAADAAVELFEEQGAPGLNQFDVELWPFVYGFMAAFGQYTAKADTITGEHLSAIAASMKTNLSKLNTPARLLTFFQKQTKSAELTAELGRVNEKIQAILENQEKGTSKTVYVPTALVVGPVFAQSFTFNEDYNFTIPSPFCADVPMLRDSPYKELAGDPSFLQASKPLISRRLYSSSTKHVAQSEIDFSKMQKDETFGYIVDSFGAHGLHHRDTAAVVDSMRQFHICDRFSEHFRHISNDVEDALTRYLSLMILTTALTKSQLLRLLKNRIALPVNFILLQPFAMVDMYRALAMKSGPTSAIQFVNPAVINYSTNENEVGRYNFKFRHGVMIVNQRNFGLQRNIMMGPARSGYTTKLVSVDDLNKEDRIVKLASGKIGSDEPEMGSVFAYMVSPVTEVRGPIALLGPDNFSIPRDNTHLENDHTETDLHGLEMFYAARLHLYAAITNNGLGGSDAHPNDYCLSGAFREILADGAVVEHAGSSALSHIGKNHRLKIVSS